MPSPFPGMDPYLEQHWGDVHHSLITYARDQLRPVLPGDLRARVEERVFVETAWGPMRRLVPDLRIVEGRGRKPRRTPTVSAGTALAEPLVVQLDEPVTQGFIEIREASPGHRLVTVIEVLSLANKLPGEGQDKYLQKQHELREGGVSSVEIDLLRGGKRPLPLSPEVIPAEYRTAYQVWLRRGWLPGAAEIYRVPLRERLPVIPIPLRETDGDARLDLQALIEACYRNGGYEDDIDYRKAPDPPLTRSDARWAEALLRKPKHRDGNGSGGSSRRRKGR